MEVERQATQEGAQPNLSLDLSLPVNEGVFHGISPTHYSSASESSLKYAEGGQGGMWKMTINNDSLGISDLDIDDIMEDQNLLDDMLKEVGDPIILEMGMEGQKQMGVTSPFKQAALQDLGVENALNMKPALQQNADVLVQGQASTVGQLMNDNEGMSADIGTEISRVMKKVDEAMDSIIGRQHERKMKEVMAKDVGEMKKLVNNTLVEESIQAMTFNEDGAILLLSSGSSPESRDNKRKRRGPTADRRGSVASRLRKKDKKGVNEQELATKQAKGKEKLKKMVVRKVKASAVKPCTSLTLAPPTMGLPTP